MKKDHHDKTSLIWTCNIGEGTSGYRTYERSYEVNIDGKPPLSGSSNPSFLGVPIKSNPEVVLTEERMIAQAEELHAEANWKCFITNTLNTRIEHAAKMNVYEP